METQASPDSTTATDFLPNEVRHLPLTPDDRKQLLDGGFTDEAIDKSRAFRAEPGQDLRALLNRRPDESLPNTGGIAFPNPHDPEHVVVRLDQPWVPPGGGEARYLGPSRRSSRLYIPAFIGPDDDGECPIYVVEGIKKAIVLRLAGLYAIAGMGVWSFHDAAALEASRAAGHDDWKLHPDFMRLKLRGRKFVIVFDSDIDSKRDVFLAAMRLVQMLQAAGAQVFISYIEPGPDGSKRGPDDLFVTLQKRASSLRDALTTAERPVDPDQQQTWLAKRQGLDSTARARELRRLARSARALLEDLAFKTWARTAAKTLDSTTATDLTDASTWNAPAAAPPTSAEGWMDAPGFRVTDEGLFKLNGNNLGEQITPTPINVVGTATDEQGSHYRVVRWGTGERAREITVPALILAGSAILQLADQGAPVIQPNAQDLQRFLMFQTSKNAKRIPHFDAFTQFGWSPAMDAYVVGETVIGKPGRSIVNADRKFLAAFEARGSRQEYLELYANVRAQSDFARMQVAAGLAGPLLRLLELRSVVVSAWGKSSKGKSALHATAMSAWGLPEDIMVPADISSAGFEGVLIRSNDGTAWIDDTQLMREALFDHLAYQVGSGSTRARATQTGKLRERQTWHVVALISGEKPLLRIGAPPGARNRTIELQVVPFKDDELPGEAHRTFKRNHGHIARPFIEGLMQKFIAPGNLKALRAIYEDICTKIAPEQSEVGRHAALLVLADVLGQVLCFGADQTVALESAVRAGQAILPLAVQSSVQAQDATDIAYEHIVAAVAQHAKNFQNNAIDRYGALFKHEGKDIAAILPEPMNRIAKDHGFDVQAILTDLRERKLLVAGEAGRLTTKTPEIADNNISGRPRAYWIVLPPDSIESMDDKVQGLMEKMPPPTPKPPLRAVP